MMKTNKRPSRGRGFSASKKSSRIKPRFNNKKGREGSRSSRPRSGGGNGRQGKRNVPAYDPTKFISANPITIEQEQEEYLSKNTFHTFGLNKKLANRVEEMGISTPSPIQDQIIPEIMQGHDVVGLAETGTGKTAAFLLPLIEKTLKDHNRSTLILAPTRELAIQIDDELKKFSKGFRLFSTVCVGGTNIQPQIRGLRKKNHFIIGTPGRVLDLINQKELRTREITTVVLDEADRMLDMGFIHDMRKIIGATPKDRETFFFSATMNSDAQKLVHDFLKQPVQISVKKRDVTTSVKQSTVSYKKEEKFETLHKLLTKPEYNRVLIFVGMKFAAKRLAKDLERKGIAADSIHGNKSHAQRQRALEDVKNGKLHVLVATDVAARGIHIEDISHVINYDLPSSFEDYVHRIGRTGRGVKRGEAVTFVQEK